MSLDAKRIFSATDANHEQADQMAAASSQKRSLAREMFIIFTL